MENNIDTQRVVPSKKKVTQLLKEITVNCSEFKKLTICLDTLKKTESTLPPKVTRTLNKTCKVLDRFVVSMEKRLVNDKRQGGFDKTVKISQEFMNFLKLDVPEINRQDITLALNVYCHINEDKNDEKHSKWYYLNPDHRDLRNPRDKRIIEVERDVELAKILNYEKYIEDVKNGLVFKDLSIERFRQLTKSTNIVVEDNKKYITKNGKKYEVVDVVINDKIKKRLIETDPSVMLCTLQKLISTHILK